MEKKLYVGNLAYETTEDALREYFSQAGQVESVAVVKDKLSGRSRGFGFVEMATEEDAKKAKEMFDGAMFEGRNLNVDEARPMQKREPGVE